MTELERALVEYDGDNTKPFCDLVYKALKTQQKVDAGKMVEVVYCSDCIHGLRNKYSQLFCGDMRMEQIHQYDFCSYGRREG